MSEPSLRSRYPGPRPFGDSHADQERSSGVKRRASNCTSGFLTPHSFCNFQGPAWAKPLCQGVAVPATFEDLLFAGDGSSQRAKRKFGGRRRALVFASL